MLSPFSTTRCISRPTMASAAASCGRQTARTRAQCRRRTSVRRVAATCPFWKSSSNETRRFGRRNTETRVKFSFFHLMPYTHLELESHDWPFPNRYFDPAKASALYRTYVDSMIHAESCGFDWVGCNEHHFSPYGMMANCNLIGGALA